LNTLLDGKKIANQILDNIKTEINFLAKQPVLAIVLASDDEASKTYVNLKVKQEYQIIQNWNTGQLTQTKMILLIVYRNHYRK
jgi:5,10-methylene-tetrahydrofolate dehydrogenase/methenyl tetrahydrofolate cyclohydrolase